MRVRLKRDELLRILAASPLSQNHWALKLGFSRGHWSEIVNGKHPYPSPRTRERLLEVLGVAFEALFVIEEGGSGPDAELDFAIAIRPRYSLIRELAQGGMGTVHLAMDVQHGRQVALKVVSAEAVGGIGAPELLKEIRLVARLLHPNILPLFDSGETAGQPWYVMPWIRDGSLRDLLSREGRLTPERAMALLAPIAAALDYGHGEQILHCDIKPENILLYGGHPYVMDFGIARKIHSESREWAGVRRELDFSAGTPAYVSPEQANGEPDLDARSDVFSVACVAYEMLAGRPPFQGTTTREIVTRRFRAPAPDLREWAPEVPPAMVRVVEQAMALERDRRPPTAGAFVAAMQDALRGRAARLAGARIAAARAVGRTGRRLGLHPTQWLGGLLSGLGKDLAQAWRGLRRAPGFALVVILTLGLALGANATMFGVADRLLLSPPAGIGHPDQVRRVLVARWINGADRPRPSMSYPHFEDYRDRTRSFSHVAAMDETVYSLGTGATARPVTAALVTGQYFELLEARVFLGRFFGEPEDRPPSGTPVVVLSHGFWRSAFGGDTAVVGRTISLGNQPYVIIGVSQRGFNGTDLTPVDVWLPMSTMTLGVFGETGWRTSRGSQWLQVFARLKPDVPLDAAQADATQAYRSSHLDEGGEFHRRAETRLGSLVAGGDGEFGRTGRVTAWLLGVAGILLIISCANVANLMLARGLMRRSEFAVRLALGVSRWRLLRQLLTESLLLAGLGAVAGGVILFWGTDLMRAVLVPDTAWDGGPFNRRVLLVTLGAMLFAALGAGLFPLRRATRVDLAAQLHGSARSTEAQATRVRGVLLLVQTSLATALLIGAGLFLRSIRAVRQADLGFEPHAVSVVSVNLGALGASPLETGEFYRAAAERLRQVPGVLAVGGSVAAPFMSSWGGSVRVPGLDSIPRLAGGGPYRISAGAGMLEALGVRLLRGRLFTPADDRPDAAPVALVTERTARLLWPGRDALGTCLLIGDDEEADGGADRGWECHTVVGVIADMHRQTLEESARPFLLYLLPLGRKTGENAVPEQLFVRTAGPPRQFAEVIRRTLLEVRPDLPWVRIQPYEDLIDQHARSWRLGASVLTAFGGISLVIAAIGLYGVLSYAVAHRRQELGIRSALGATPGSLLGMVVGGGVRAAILGVVLGGGLALLLANRLQPLLFRTSPRDPLVFGAAALLVVLIALVASLVPGRRATRVDPLSAIRAE